MPSLLPMIAQDIRGSDLDSLVCDDDDPRGRRIRQGLGWIVDECVKHRKSNLGTCLGIREDEMEEIRMAASESSSPIPMQIRLMIYQWSGKGKPRGEATVRRFLQALFFGCETTLLLNICMGKLNMITPQNAHHSVISGFCLKEGIMSKSWGERGYKPKR